MHRPVWQPLAIRTSAARLVRIGEEQLLSVDLVSGDRRLPVRRDQPVDEVLPQFLLDVRKLRGGHQHHAVLIEQPLVAFDDDVEIAAIPKSDPAATAGQYIGVRRARYIKG